MDISPHAVVRKQTSNGAGGRRFDDFCLHRRLRGLSSRQPMVQPVTTCVFFFFLCVCVFFTRPSHPYNGEHAVYGRIYV